MSFPEIRTVLVFGSRAEGNFSEGSDIDLALKGDLSFDLLLKIKVKLDDLNLPYNIDLHDYNKIKSPELKKRVDEGGMILLSPKSF